MTKPLIKSVIIILIFSSCQQNGDYYFHFDEVNHYSIKIDENELFDLEEKKNISKNQQLKLDIILNNKPKKITDTIFIPRLTVLGFKKNKVPSTKHVELNKIFREKHHDEVYALACVHVYRDILIFKKSDSIIGIAKICFDCLNSQILGTSANTIEFGQSGDYGKLYKLLNYN